MEEIEILVEVKDNLKDAIRALKKFKKIGTFLISDTYFYNNNNKELSYGKNKKMGGSLRIRSKAEKTILTYKKDYFDGDVWSHSDEFEVLVEDKIKIKEIINNLGFEDLAILNMKKHIFSYNNYEIVLEEVEKLGIFLEVEYKENSKEKSVKDIKKEIWNFIKSLKIKTSEELNSGKLELYLNKVKQ